MDYTNYMKILIKKLLAATLSAMLFVAPLAYAQEVPADLPVAESVSNIVPTESAVPLEPIPPVVETPVAESAPAADTASPDLQGTEPVQDTANTQPAVSSDTLENTANPEMGTSTDIVLIPIIDATTTVLFEQVLDDAQGTSAEGALPVAEATSTLDIVAEDIAAEVKEDEPTPEPLPLVAEEVASVALAELTPDPEFTFSLTGKQIPSKRTLISKDGKKIGEQTVTSPLASQVDNTAGVVSVSGQCSDVYFVVLLYRNQNDYADDPSSYIVNRAFPCVNGSYSYAIADLPNNLANGQYYLLVGQQGERGTWAPITSLTEITINKN